MIEESRKRRLLENLERLEAYQEIQNQMGRAVAAFNFREAEKLEGFFALEDGRLAVEIADEGVFEGKEAVTALIRETVGRAPEKGEMIDIQLTTPVIEVAGDLQSARAIWWCPGAASVREEDKDPRALWLWGDLACDFVREGGTWKILRLHYFRVIKCSYEKGWVEDTSMINRPNAPMHPLSKPTTFHNPYSPLGVRCGVPAPPFAYETDDGEKWMLRSDKTK